MAGGCVDHWHVLFFWGRALYGSKVCESHDGDGGTLF
jgi:hypothetical protein